MIPQAPKVSADEKFAAFCGIAHPERFQRTLEKIGNVFWVKAFPDHHPYSDTDLQQLVEAKKRLGASKLLTTDKDYFKLNERFSALGESLQTLRIGYDLSPDFWYFLENRWMSK